MIATDTLITSRDTKGLQAFKLFEEVYNEAKLNDEQAERLNQNQGNQFTDELLALIRKHSATNQYANEVTSSNHTYPKGYRGPKLITDQIKMIGKLFGLETEWALRLALGLPELPAGAEGWFAVPKLSAVAAKHFPKMRVNGTDYVYCEAVKLVHKKLADSRSFTSYDEREIVPSKLRRHPRTVKLQEEFERKQSGDILIIPAQLGMLHRGKSIRRARETFANNEYGLGSFAVCSIALTHPEHFVQSDELDTDCAGDEFSPGGDGTFSEAPNLLFDDKFSFNTRNVSEVRRHFGSASGFIVPLS
jgi:hypothetical protein